MKIRLRLIDELGITRYTDIEESEDTEIDFGFGGCNKIFLRVENGELILSLHDPAPR